MQSQQPGPSMHKPVPMGTRVRYIVSLDEPIEVDGEPHHAISVPGSLLDSEDGTTN